MRRAGMIGLLLGTVACAGVAPAPPPPAPKYALQVALSAGTTAACASYATSAEAKLAAALELARGAGRGLDGQPLPPLQALLAGLGEDEAPYTIVLDSYGNARVDQAGLAALAQSCTAKPAKSEKERKALTACLDRVTRSGRALFALNQQSVAAGAAFVEANVGAQTCHSLATLAALRVESAAAADGGIAPDPALERAEFTKIVDALAKLNASAASATSLVALFQAGAARALPEGAAGALVTALDAARATPPTGRPEEVEAFFTLAKAKAIEAKARQAELDRLSGRPSGPAPVAGGDVLNLVGSLLTGNAAGVLAAAVTFLPAEHPVRSSLEGVSAVMSGDFRGAIGAARKLAPKDSSVGTALAALPI